MADPNICGCCEGVRALTPASLENPPGQPALTYRVGTHARFKQSMQADLANEPALAPLTTRADDDAAIALLDAWATTLDVLTFYQERIANEGFLRTATERMSLLELARSIGYELRPGVAASTLLAFQVETIPGTNQPAPGAPNPVSIKVGTKAQTIPGQDELPQTFETIEEISARAEWNLLKPKQTKAKIPEYGSKELHLQGVATQLKPGDALLIIGQEQLDDPANERWDFRRVETVTPLTEKNITRVTWQEGLGWHRRGTILPAAINQRVYTFRTRANLFGYNAPEWRTMSLETRKNFGDATDPAAKSEWPKFTIKDVSEVNNDAELILYLDALYPQIIPASWIVVSAPDYQEVYFVDKASEDERKAYALASKAMRLELTGENLYEKFNKKIREVVVFAQSEELTLVEAPDPSPIHAGTNTLELDSAVEHLAAGQPLILAGNQAATGDPIAEAVTLAQVNGAQLVFTKNLVNSYQRDTAKIFGNVARATHGETKTQILGNGDGAQPFQKFQLKDKPLTYVAASDEPSGARSTLQVRVNDLLWQETAALYGLKPRDRAFITRRDDVGETTVQFGDGAQGARLPSGDENVQATYRVGIGLAGMVKAEQISLLMTRPLGAKSVVNPIAPEGAQDPETRDRARQNAPLTVLTLDRIVSLQDYQDFASAYAGIGKAQAVWLWDGEKRIAHLTVASAAGAPVAENSELRERLRQAIAASCDPTQNVVIGTYMPLFFTLRANVKLDATYIEEKVLAAITQALQSAFSFEARGFGQRVTESEVIALIQNIPGVVYVDLDALRRTDKPNQKPPLRAHIARREGGVIQPAELLTLSQQANAIQLTVLP